MSVSPEELKKRQAWLLAEKVKWALKQIRIWYDYWDGKVYVAFSGGKDSTVLLHLVRSLYPEVPAVFCNTGLEFPEIVKFVKSVENVITLRPEMTFRAVIKKFGWPLVSKRVAKSIRVVRENKPDTENTRRLIMTGVSSKGYTSTRWKLAEKWRKLLTAPFSVSEKCCDVMKKNPSKKYAKETGRKVYLGTMASDSILRNSTYLKTGCNAFHSSDPASAPMSIWTEKDVWDYIKQEKLPYSDIYDKGYDRTGCIFCAFGAHMEPKPGRFVLLRRTHLKLWKFCMNTLGMREVLRFIDVPTGDDRTLKCLREKGKS
ncbi:MAG: phosphoadenosine phosphosulfate reductase family protein [Gammaproteobacteria bacterium]|nr:phosphoadenosine phosphosulfate reductase family protein [Gammaproteobacteria bacterium]